MHGEWVAPQVSRATSRRRKRPRQLDRPRRTLTMKLRRWVQSKHARRVGCPPGQPRNLQTAKTAPATRSPTTHIDHEVAPVGAEQTRTASGLPPRSAAQPPDGEN